MTTRFWILVIILPAILLASCTTPYETARKSFYRATRAYLRQEQEDALVRYCQSLSHLETGGDKNVSNRLLKAAIYHRLSVMNAKGIYQNSDDKTKEKYASFAELLSRTGESGFLDSAFSEIIASEKDLRNTDMKSIDPFLLIQRDLIVADKLSRSLDRRDKAASTTGEAAAESRLFRGDAALDGFTKAADSYGYGEIIKALYLDAWSLAIVQYHKTLPDRDLPHWTNESLYGLSLQHLKDAYHALSANSALLKTPAFQEAHKRYSGITTKIDALPPQPNFSSLAVSSPKQAATDLLGEAPDKNYLILDPAFHLNEARSRMSQSVEMIVTGKPDKAESLLLNALMNVICAREFSTSPSPADTRLINTTLDDIRLNLYRISSGGK
ncbi:MAG: hypothetical protein AB1599_08710 [Planctomycetota bacterium]